MLEKSASPRHSCTSPACLAPQTISLLSPCTAQVAPSLPEQTASKYLPGLVPCPMDDKCHSSIQKHCITALRLWSKLSYRQRHVRAEPPSRRRARGGGAGGNGGERGGRGASSPWGALLLSAEDTPPHSPARFQSLMTFVNHQPARLHQQTLPADTPFNTKAVAMPFKRGSLKAPLCGREEKQHTHKSLFPPFPSPRKTSDPLETPSQSAFSSMSLLETSGQLTKWKTRRTNLKF